MTNDYIRKIFKSRIKNRILKKKIEMNIFLVFISAVMAFSLVFKYCLNLVWLAREVANGNIRSWKPKSDMEGKFNRDLIPKVSSNGKSAIVMMSTSWCLEH